MDKFKVYICLHIASKKSTAGKKLGFLLVRSSFLLAGFSFWSKRSGTST